MTAACVENGAARQQVTAGGTRNRFRWPTMQPCSDVAMQGLRDDVEQVRTALGQSEPDAATRPGAIFALSQLMMANSDQLRRRLAQIRTQTTEMQAAAQ